MNNSLAEFWSNFICQAVLQWEDVFLKCVFMYLMYILINIPEGNGEREREREILISRKKISLRNVSN